MSKAKRSALSHHNLEHKIEDAARYETCHQQHEEFTPNCGECQQKDVFVAHPYDGIIDDLEVAQYRLTRGRKAGIQTILWELPDQERLSVVKELLREVLHSLSLNSKARAIEGLEKAKRRLLEFVVADLGSGGAGQ